MVTDTTSYLTVSAKGQVVQLHDYLLVKLRKHPTVIVQHT